MLLKKLKNIIVLQVIFLFSITFFVSAATTYTFTNCGATGITGPSQSQINSAYSGTNLSGKVSKVSNGIQEWTVPVGGKYTIEVWGASSVETTYHGGTYGYGKGAKLKGNFQLKAGDKLQILVGQKPITNDFNGGGGGTFVAKGSSYSVATPLIIGGGGGSVRHYPYSNYAGYHNLDIANASHTEIPKNGEGTGGTPGSTSRDGGSGSRSGACTGGAGGAGFYSNGGLVGENRGASKI